MPYENVTRTVTVNDRVRVCARCGVQIPEIANQKTVETVGGVGGSLAGSIGASMLVGSALGPVGAIGGAVVGSVIGFRAGRKASDRVCEKMEARDQNQWCSQCKHQTDKNLHDEKNHGWGTSWQTLGHGRK